MERHQDLQHIASRAQMMLDLEINQCIQCEEDFILQKNMFTNHCWDNAIERGLCEQCDVTLTMQERAI